MLLKFIFHAFEIQVNQQNLDMKRKLFNSLLIFLEKRIHLQVTSYSFFNLNKIIGMDKFDVKSKFYLIKNIGFLFVKRLIKLCFKNSYFNSTFYKLRRCNVWVEFQF